jgi:hypothetical protein
VKVHNLPSCPVCDHPLVNGKCEWHGSPSGPFQVKEDQVTEIPKGPAESAPGVFHPNMQAVKARKKHDRIMQNTPVIVNQADQSNLVDSIRDLLLEDRAQREEPHILPSRHQTKQLGSGNGDTRFCTQCGAPISSNDRFCAGCGTPLQHEIIIEPDQEDESEKERSDRKSGRDSTPMF